MVTGSDRDGENGRRSVGGDVLRNQACEERWRQRLTPHPPFPACPGKQGAFIYPANEHDSCGVGFKSPHHLKETKKKKKKPPPNGGNSCQGGQGRPMNNPAAILDHSRRNRRASPRSRKNGGMAAAFPDHRPSRIRFFSLLNAPKNGIWLPRSRPAEYGVASQLFHTTEPRGLEEGYARVVRRSSRNVGSRQM